MFTDDALHKIKAKPFTVVIRFAVATNERLEDGLDTLGRNARTIINDRKHVVSG